MTNSTGRPIKTAVLILVVAVGFVAMIVDASLDGSVTDGLVTISQEPWGLVTLADLSIGIVFVACWIAALVGVRRAIPWWVGLALLGNLMLLIFLLVRFRQFANAKAALLHSRSV